MENIYVIKVKTKPSLSSLYPSERRYSASTVGGLSFVHFILGALSLFLGTLALSLQGPILSVACLCPFVAGLCAWKRWYIDRNIRIFFYANAVSLVFAILCSIATIFDVTTIVQSGRTSGFWTDGDFGQLLTINESSRFSSEGERFSEADKTFPREFVQPITLDDRPPEEIFRKPEGPLESSTIMDFLGFKDFDGSFLNYDNAEAESSVDYVIRNAEKELVNASANFPGRNVEERRMNFQEEFARVSEKSLKSEDEDLRALLQLEMGDSTARNSGEKLRNATGGEFLKSERLFSFLRDDYRRSPHTKIFLAINVLIAALLEVFWSLLSAKIALRGMQNRSVEATSDNNAATTVKSSGKTSQKKRAPAPKPDILEHDHGILQNIQRYDSSQLPLPESNREFRERVERFLTNQAAQRLVEGSPL